jgi:hypothetical protein
VLVLAQVSDPGLATSEGSSRGDGWNARHGPTTFSRLRLELFFLSPEFFRSLSRSLPVTVLLSVHGSKAGTPSIPTRGQSSSRKKAVVVTAAGGHWCESRRCSAAGPDKQPTTAAATNSCQPQVHRLPTHLQRACNYYRPCFSLETSVHASIEVGPQDDLGGFSTSEPKAT